MDKAKLEPFLLLHGSLLLYSLSTVCSKMASGHAFLSMPFLFWYGLVLAALFLYAILWQQVLKKMPLTTAFSNKAVTVLWGMLWGAALFGEAITPQKLAGAAIIVAGILLVVREKAHE